MQRLFGLAKFAAMIAYGFAARSEEMEDDPAKVSESLQSIFQLGSASTEQSLNANTVTLISGTNEAMHVIAPKAISSLRELAVGPAS